MITIDEAIKELSKWKKDLNYDNGDYYYGGDTTEHSLDCAISIMHKYQKIEQIVGNNDNDGIIGRLVREVVEDGN